MVVGQDTGVDSSSYQHPRVPGVHAIVDPLGSVVLAQRDAGLELDDPKGGSHLLQHLEGLPPDVLLIHLTWDGAAGPPGHFDIVHCRGHNRLSESGRADPGEDLVVLRPVITSPERKSFIGWVIVVGGCAVDRNTLDPERWAGHPGFRQVTSFWKKTAPASSHPIIPPYNRAANPTIQRSHGLEPGGHFQLKVSWGKPPRIHTRFPCPPRPAGERWRGRMSEIAGGLRSEKVCKTPPSIDRDHPQRE